jgi:hypothetical protein
MVSQFVNEKLDLSEKPYQEQILQTTELEHLKISNIDFRAQCYKNLLP